MRGDEKLMLDQATAFLIAILAALIYAIGSYVKHTPSEEFSEEKLFVTVAIGLIIGVISFKIGTSYGATEQLLISAGAIVYLEIVLKIVYRRLKPWIEKMRKDTTEDD